MEQGMCKNEKEKKKHCIVHSEDYQCFNFISEPKVSTRTLLVLFLPLTWNLLYE